MTMSANPSMSSPSPWMTVAVPVRASRSRPRAPSSSSRRWARRRAAGRRRRPGRRAAPGRSCRGRARRRAGTCGARRPRPRRPGPGAASARGRRAASDVRGLGQRHAGGGTVAAYLEGAEQRAEQLPVGEPARPGRGSGPAAWKSGVRNGLASWREMTDCGTTRRSTTRGTSVASSSSSSSTSTPARSSIDRRISAAWSETLGVLGEQREERRLAGGGLGQDRRDAVEPLELAVALGLGQGGVGPDPGPLLARQQGDGLEPRAHRAAWPRSDGGLDLAHGRARMGIRPSLSRGRVRPCRPLLRRWPERCWP